MEMSETANGMKLYESYSPWLQFFVFFFIHACETKIV